MLFPSVIHHSFPLLFLLLSPIPVLCVTLFSSRFSILFLYCFFQIPTYLCFLLFCVKCIFLRFIKNSTFYIYEESPDVYIHFIVYYYIYTSVSDFFIFCYIFREWLFPIFYTISLISFTKIGKNKADGCHKFNSLTPEILSFNINF